MIMMKRRNFKKRKKKIINKKTNKFNNKNKQAISNKNKIISTPINIKKTSIIVSKLNRFKKNKKAHIKIKLINKKINLEMII